MWVVEVSTEEISLKKETAIEKITKTSRELPEFHVKALYIFGSVARDEAENTSDVDILVEFTPEARIGLFRFLQLKNFLEGILGCSVDLVTADGLHPMMRDSILEERIRVA
ncbi:MAG: nucleotidyltransferase family protein [Thermovirgaceae bacterium]|nr:nucleotidyltransferase family protein [Thermovirgaceae bacterium]